MNHHSLTVAALAVGLVIALSPLANAACPVPFTAKDGAGSSQNLASVNNASNNCEFTQVIGDGGGANNLAAVKAGSTSAAAGDPSLVVNISPNSPALAVTPTSNASVNVNQWGGSAVPSGGVAGTPVIEQGCAGQSIANTTVTPFSLASSTALKLVSKVSAKKVYICQINLVTATAQNIALIEGTHGTNDCDTSTAGLAGGSTAATGWNLAVNGVFHIGTGIGLVAKSGTANEDVCLISSSTGQISGTITWAQF